VRGSEHDETNTVFSRGAGAGSTAGAATMLRSDRNAALMARSCSSLSGQRAFSYWGVGPTGETSISPRPRTRSAPVRLK
jgi:hypothetical protein